MAQVLLRGLLLFVFIFTEATDLRVYLEAAELTHSNTPVTRGSTVVLVCTETPTPQQVDYQWTCPSPPCVGQYRKVYGNVLVVVATTATSGTYRCRPTPGNSQYTTYIGVQTALTKGQLALYNNGRLLLPNTLFTNSDQIPNGFTCSTGRRAGVPRFRRENGSTMYFGSRSTQSTRVQAMTLQPNGGYWCFDSSLKTKFHVYYNNAILPTPQVSVGSTTTDQQLHLLLTPPPPYNTGRFILRYDCALGEAADIEVEYRSADPGVNSNTVVTRSRSCFVVGEISRVTVWFINGEKISTTPAVVHVAGLRIIDIPSSAATLVSSVPSPNSMRSFLSPTATNAGLETKLSTKCPIPTSAAVGIDPSTNTAIIIGATTANLLILLLSITLLVISGVLIVRSRNRYTSTLQTTSNFQVNLDTVSRVPAVVQIYDEIDDSFMATSKHTIVHTYQDLDACNMDSGNPLYDSVKQ